MAIIGHKNKTWIHFKGYMNKYILIIVISISNFYNYSLADGCFSVIVGKDASANGYVMFAHTEDFTPAQNINIYKVSRDCPYPQDITLPDNADSTKHHWSQIIAVVSNEMSSDCIMNEYGVIIASNQCPSLQDKPELIEGGIGKGLRYLVAARATSARNGVQIAGEVVEKVGYNAGGRAYIICDSQEGWVFCVIGGKYWLAQRVNDDEVAVIANAFTVRDINLNDSSRFMASNGLIEYAIARGWYDSDESDVFDFGKVFCDSVAATASYNVCRQWSGLRWLVNDTVPATWTDLPFSLRPDSKLGVVELMHIMQDHYENTALYIVPDESSSPHENRFMTICSQITQMSFIAELRVDIPKDIGFLLWLCLGKPCTSFYVPFYFGIDDIPGSYQIATDESSTVFQNDFDSLPALSESGNAFMIFHDYCSFVDSNYIAAADFAASALESYNNSLMKERINVERRALELYREDSLKANNELQAFTLRQINSAFDCVNNVRKNSMR